MARIRLLVPVAGHLTADIPAPAVGVPVDVDEQTAATWCGAELAELVPDDVDVDDAVAAAVADVHDDAQTYLQAVEAEHAGVVAALEAQVAELKASLAKKTAKAPKAQPAAAAEPTA
jgi:hypothetical protein